MHGQSLRPEIIEELRGIVGAEHVLADAEDLLTYECAGFALHRHLPDIVVLPATRDEAARIIEIACKHRIPFIPRGAGTGLSGGAQARFGGILLSFTRMKSILQPGISERILDEKIANIILSGAQIVASGNPGCLLQIQAGLRAKNPPVRTMHPIELLDQAYSSASSKSTEGQRQNHGGSSH